jgi:zinc D-Ala-D-Ala carboxypeptidase
VGNWALKEQDMAKLTEHFTLEEAQITNHREIDNTAPLMILPVLAKTAIGMERVRACLGDKAITVSSWYRCPELNREVKSNSFSQHIKGEAVDFICPSFGSPISVVRKLAENKILIRFDQLILEHTWVHISFNSNPDVKPRGQVLTLLHNKDYAPGITDKFGVPV